MSNCRECGMPVNTESRTCHNCGAPAPAVSVRNRNITRAAIAIVALAALAVWYFTR